MNESLFHAYIAKFFPKLQMFIEKVNGKRNGNLTYLHKDTNILRREYSPDNKWESGSVDTDTLPPTSWLWIQNFLSSRAIPLQLLMARYLKAV